MSATVGRPRSSASWPRGRRAPRKPPCPSQMLAASAAAGTPAAAPRRERPPTTAPINDHPVEPRTPRSASTATRTLKGNVDDAPGRARDPRQRGRSTTADTDAIKVDGRHRLPGSAGPRDRRRRQLLRRAGCAISTTPSSSCASAPRAARPMSCSSRPRACIDLEGRDASPPARANDNSWQHHARATSRSTRARKIGTGHDARVEFKGVPMLYLPWMSFPLEQRAQERLPVSEHRQQLHAAAFSSRVPYYWNIAPNADFTFEPTYYTAAASTSAASCASSPSQHGELDWNYLPHDSNSATRRSRFSARRRRRAAARLPPDGRRGERERHAVFRGLRPGPGRHEHRLPRALRRACAIATSTGASTAEAAAVPDDRLADLRELASAPMRACRASGRRGLRLGPGASRCATASTPSS